MVQTARPVELADVSVSSLLERIVAIERETETTYLQLGSVFRAVQTAVSRNGEDADRTVQIILSEHHGGSSAEVARRRKHNFLEDSTRFFDRAAASESDFNRGVEVAIASLSSLDAIIGRIKADSEEMEIISLNAMTVALKSGSAGRAFSVITDELKQLSARTIRHADSLSQAGQSLLQKLEALKETLVRLLSAQAAFFTTTGEALKTGFETLDAEVDSTADAIRNLASRATQVRGPIGQIMQEVQLQDIIRQSLDHVRLSLRAAEPDGAGGVDGQGLVGAYVRGNAGASGASPSGADDVMSGPVVLDPDEERAFLAEISTLSSSLLDDVAGQVRTSLGRFRDGMDGVQAVMSGVEMARLSMVAERACSEAGAQFESLSAAYLAAKEKALGEAQAISNGVRLLDERFGEMHAILDRFRNIVTVSRIETAKNRALGIVSNTVTGMMELTESLSRNVAEAGDVTRSFGKALSTGMNDYLSNSAERLAALRAHVAELQREFDGICDVRRRLWDAESTFRPFSDAFSDAIAAATGAIDRIDELAAELEQMRDLLAGVVRGMGSIDINELTASIHNARLKSIVDRFTIFAHKQTAARIALLDGETGDEVVADSGEVTLF